VNRKGEPVKPRAKVDIFFTFAKCEAGSASDWGLCVCVCVCDLVRLCVCSNRMYACAHTHTHVRMGAWAQAQAHKHTHTHTHTHTQRLNVVFIPVLFQPLPSLNTAPFAKTHTPNQW
jgi:hypothetical protein